MPLAGHDGFACSHVMTVVSTLRGAKGGAWYAFPMQQAGVDAARAGGMMGRPRLFENLTLQPKRPFKIYVKAL